MDVRRERTTKLRILSNKLQRAFYERHQGSTRPVLFEKGDADHPVGTLEGYTDNYLRVSVPYAEELVDRVVPVVLERITGDGQFTGPVGAFRSSDALII
jgi:threonylcarbamoyladenosine tRNA methylthiotransferase MtaB